MSRTDSKTGKTACASSLATGCFPGFGAVGRMPHSPRISVGNLRAAARRSKGPRRPRYSVLFKYLYEDVLLARKIYLTLFI